MKITVWSFKPLALWVTTDDGLKSLEMFDVSDIEPVGRVFFHEIDQIRPTFAKAVTKQFDCSNLPLDKAIAILLSTMEKIKDESADTITDIPLDLDAEFPDKTVEITFRDRPTVSEVKEEDKNTLRVTRSVKTSCREIF
jgi:hypothetical protein